QVIGATTRDEYAKNIEKDSALERRFSVVNITEPDAEQTRQILYGIKEKYMAFHRLDILDSAVEKSVELSVKYIHHRFLLTKP
ncbi:MAG: ATP-dependent Clp protease ATP-binding subunit, partial [Oscillospiraceae bacterium]|nr:ATP-dependent Clp protease ATP-binding subunit [Oscillospiraceae bacterium]